MIHDFIKREIPTEISESGGAQVVLVNKNTIPLSTSIEEAKAGNYVIGDATLVQALFEGLFRSMADGIQRDGKARQIGDFLTLYPTTVGTFDLEKGWDPLKNSVKVNCRLLNELVIDTSGWTFRDVTPGRSPFTIDSVSSGTVDGIVKPGTATHINGKGFPANPRIHYVCGDKSGDIPAAKITCDATRINLAADALDAIAAVAYNGKPIEFTVRGAFCTARVNGTVSYTQVEHATMTNVRSSEEDPADDLSIADTVDLTFNKADPQGATGKLVVNGVVQDRPVTVSGTTATVEWTWGREELIGQQVTIGFRYNDGTVSGTVTKTIRAERE